MYIQIMSLDVSALLTVAMCVVITHSISERSEGVKGYSALCGGYLDAGFDSGGLALGGSHTRSPEKFYKKKSPLLWEDS